MYREKDMPFWLEKAEVEMRYTFLAAMGVRSDPIYAQRDTLSRATLREAIAR